MKLLSLSFDEREKEKKEKWGEKVIDYGEEKV